MTPHFYAQSPTHRVTRIYYLAVLILIYNLWIVDFEQVSSIQMEECQFVCLSGAILLLFKCYPVLFDIPTSPSNSSKYLHTAIVFLCFISRLEN